MGRNPGQRRTGEIARELSERVGSNAMLSAATSTLRGSLEVSLSSIANRRGKSSRSRVGWIQPPRPGVAEPSVVFPCRNAPGITFSFACGTFLWEPHLRFSDGSPSRNHPQRGRTTPHRWPRSGPPILRRSWNCASLVMGGHRVRLDAAVAKSRSR